MKKNNLNLIKVLILSLTFISGSILAKPILKEGTYKLANFKAMQLLKQRVVPTLDKDKDEKVKKLEESGFICRLVTRRFVKCMKHEKDFETPMFIMKKVLNEFRGKFFTVEPLQSFETLSQAPSLNMYRFFQELSHNFYQEKVTVRELLVYEGTNLNKFVAKDPKTGSQIWINQKKNGEISLFRKYKKKLSEYNYDYYSVTVEFK